MSRRLRMLAAGALVVVGAGMIYLPAGLIVAGVCVLLSLEVDR